MRKLKQKSDLDFTLLKYMKSRKKNKKTFVKNKANVITIGVEI